MISSVGSSLVPAMARVWTNMSHETSAEPPDWVMLNDHPQLRFLPDDSWIGSPEFDRRHPNCQPSTVLAYDLTWLLVPVQFQLVPQPIRSPCWQVARPEEQ